MRNGPSKAAITSPLIDFDFCGPPIAHHAFPQMIEKGLIQKFDKTLIPDVERAIADQPNLALMMAWLDAAFTVSTASDLLALMRR